MKTAFEIAQEIAQEIVSRWDSGPHAGRKEPYKVLVSRALLSNKPIQYRPFETSFVQSFVLTFGNGLKFETKSFSYFGDEPEVYRKKFKEITDALEASPGFELSHDLSHDD